MDLIHALNCKKGGLVTARHNEARDLNCDLCTLAGLQQILSEPVLQEPSDDQAGLRADWKVRGFWEVQRDALFNGRHIFLLKKRILLLKRKKGILLLKKSHLGF